MVSVNQPALRLLLLICGIWLVQSQAQAAKPVIVITQAQWSGQSLTVAGRARGTGPLVGLYDGSGRYLGQVPLSGRQRFSFTLSEPERPELLCSVRAQTAEARATARVKGRPKSCSAAPVCRILTPTSSVHTAVDTDVTFKGKATLKDRKSGPLRMEWDFGGGSLGEAADLPMQAAHRRPATATTTVRFGRDNGRYRVHLTAWDQKSRYCEDSIEVVVGTPPDTD
ncbi:MAG: cytochrome C, partial [Methylococcaceae bacterium]|nr:cytochrome C [Methylococcaceae bacterium]